MSTDRLPARVKTLEESFQTLVELAQNHDSQMDDLRATMNSLGEKVVILTDAQIKTEERMQKLTDSQQKLTDSQRELADSQRHTDDRLNALIDIVMQSRKDANTDRPE